MKRESDLASEFSASSSQNTMIGSALSPRMSGLLQVLPDKEFGAGIAATSGLSFQYCMMMFSYK